MTPSGILLALAAAVSLHGGPLHAQQPASERWLLAYDRKVSMRMQMHGAREDVIRAEKVRLSLTVRGDSVVGQIVRPASAGDPDEVVGEVRGLRRNKELALQITSPRTASGFIATQWDALMVWMRETMHGVVPTYAKLQLTVNGDEISGSRTVVTVDGAIVDGPRPVTGRREKP